MSAQASAELAHLKAHKAAFPGTLTLGTRTLACAVIAERGKKWDGDGGQIQQRTVSFLVACRELPDSEIIDATTDATRAVRFTHVQTGRIYTLSDDRPPQKSPAGVFWSLHATQPTTT